MPQRFSPPLIPQSVPADMRAYIAALIEELRRLDRRIQDLEDEK